MTAYTTKKIKNTLGRFACYATQQKWDKLDGRPFDRALDAEIKSMWAWLMAAPHSLMKKAAKEMIE